MSRSSSLARVPISHLFPPPCFSCPCLQEMLSKAFVTGYAEAEKSEDVILCLVEPFGEILTASKSIMTLLTPVPDVEMFTNMSSWFDVKAVSNKMARHVAHWVDSLKKCPPVLAKLQEFWKHAEAEERHAGDLTAVMTAVTCGEGKEGLESDLGQHQHPGQSSGLDGEDQGGAFFGVNLPGQSSRLHIGFQRQ